MKKLIGNEIKVFLTVDTACVSGMFYDCDDESIYLKTTDNLVCAIPQRNIKYCIGANDVNDYVEPDTDYHEDNVNVLNVSINGSQIASVRVAPDFDLSTCSDDVIKKAYSHPDVKNALKNVVQNRIEYEIGNINIITGSKNPSQNIDFSMSGNIGSNTINPIDMVSRISKEK